MIKKNIQPIEDLTMEDLLNQEIIKLMVGYEIIINEIKVAKIISVDKYGEADIEEYYSYEDKEFYTLVDESILDFSEKCFYKALELSKSKMVILTKEIGLAYQSKIQSKTKDTIWTIFDIPPNNK